MKQIPSPPFWGGVRVKKWSPFFDSGARSPIFGHLKMPKVPIMMIKETSLCVKYIFIHSNLSTDNNSYNSKPDTKVTKLFPPSDIQLFSSMHTMAQTALQNGLFVVSRILCMNIETT